jgi:hypothetical protein
MNARIVAVRAAFVAVVLAGCQGLAPSTPVSLLIGEASCNTLQVGSHTGLLVADATYGTAFIEDAPATGGPEPVAWRPGFTGRQVGSEVEVLDPRGNVTNTTGQRVALGGLYWPIGSVWAFVNCSHGGPT